MTKLVCLVALALAGGCQSKPTEQGAGSSKTNTPTTPTGSAQVVADAPMGSAAGSNAGSDTGSAAGSGSDTATEEPKSEFDKLSHDDKIKFMKTKVMPVMKPIFQKFDPKEYANFGCKTCHGKDPQKSKYKMPNPELPKLDFAKLKAGKQAPEMAEFMEKTVKPEMAKIMGVPEMTESNPTGFGCLACHTLKKK